jgi:hypothetical protein
MSKEDLVFFTVLALARLSIVVIGIAALVVAVARSR